ncbi:hypothetical protein [uncultured Rikenella sp.]|uniref:hypothetical protein n=1 Tax=uncultured Rikenella sp. TaxID=368003 RepID=UPI0025FD02F5|nr:hypothetical protein [uncultured Rikenella sp.]
METWIIYVIAPIAVAIVSWILGKNGRRIDETSKLVGMQQEEIRRLDRKVDRLEAKLEAKDDALDRKSAIIQAAFLCRIPSVKCPVLIKQDEFNQQKYNDVKRIEKPESGEYSPKPDPVQGGDCECGPGI